MIFCPLRSSRRHRLAYAAIIVALVANVAAASAAPWPSESAALARAAAASYEAAERGVVAFDVMMTTTIRGGFYHRTDQDMTAFVSADGKVVHKVVLRHIEGGKADDRAALHSRDIEAETPLSRFGMRLPCDPSALTDYTFEAAQTSAGLVTLPFRARVRDQAHGDGIIALDAGGTHIVSITFQPAQPPERASSAKVEISFGSIGSGRYGISKIVRTFGGHVGPMRGTVTSTSIYENTRVFANTTAAIESIERER